MNGRGEPTAGPAPVLVLGLGNVLLQDDGVGSRLVSELAKRQDRWTSVELADGGTLGMALLGMLDGRRALVLLDAVRTGAKPGTARELTPEEVQRSRPPAGLSPHEGSALEILRAAALLGDLPEKVIIVGVEPFAVETGYGLSAEVEAGLPAALDLVIEVIDRAVAGAT
jgi:hydrogenase maturation protease